MANQSIKAAFERMWQHVVSALSNKSDKSTTLSGYGITNAYTKTEVDGVTSNLQTHINNLTDYAEGIYDNAIASYDEAAVANSSTELVNGIAMYEFINKIKNMMCTTYDLTCSVAVESDYTITVNSAKLIGNNLSFELTIERSSNCTAGDIANETVGTIIVTHDGKITGFRRVSIPPANYGGLASFFMANLTTEDTTLQFDIGLAATGTACKKWSIHFTLPVKINMDAY